VVVPSADQVSSDAGLLPFRQLDERIGLTGIIHKMRNQRASGCV
jgi:hypothetical protein